MSERIEYKKTLLDSVVIRVDYPGSIIDLPDTIKYVMKTLKDLGFADMRKGRVGQGQINVNLKDPSQPPEIEFTSQGGDNYFFYNDIYEIQINETYVMFGAKLNKKFIRFTEYYKFILRIISEILASNNNYLKIIRIGLQKVNVLFDENASRRFDYFSNNVFPASVLPEFNDSLVLNQNLENYFSEKCNVNYGRYYDNGTLIDDGKEKLVYRFVLDIDAYVTEQNNHDMIVKINSCTNFEEAFDSILIDLNNVIFRFFENSCSEKLKNLLKE